MWTDSNPICPHICPICQAVLTVTCTNSQLYPSRRLATKQTSRTHTRTTHTGEAGPLPRLAKNDMFTVYCARGAMWDVPCTVYRCSEHSCVTRCSS